MPAAPHPLVAVLQQVAAGPRNHYLVLTSYLETPGGPVVPGSLHLHQPSVGELAIGPEARTCEVRLAPQAGRVPVRVAYARIWQVQHGPGPQFTAADEAGVLYVNNQVLASFAREGLAE